MAASIFSWDAGVAVMPATNAPQALYTAGTNFPRVTLAFDPTTSEVCYFFGVMPTFYAEGALNLKVFWTSTGTLAVVWGAKHLGRIDDEVFDNALSAATKVTDTITAANDIMVATIAIAAPALDVGDWFVLEMARYPADAGDTSATDAQLISLELQE
jgi:hypothetical protein